MPSALDLLSEKPVIHAVYFPLIALLIPKWFSLLAHEERFADATCHKLLYLISGSGVPRDPTAHAIQNSTQTTAKLITFFIDTFYDNVQTVPIHSSTPGMFRYGMRTIIENSEEKMMFNGHSHFCLPQFKF